MALQWQQWDLPSPTRKLFSEADEITYGKAAGSRIRLPRCLQPPLSFHKVHLVGPTRPILAQSSEQQRAGGLGCAQRRARLALLWKRSTRSDRASLTCRHSCRSLSSKGWRDTLGTLLSYARIQSGVDPWRETRVS